jgi:hypothetical protein
MLGASRDVVGWRGSFVRTGVQFVTIAHPRKTSGFDIVEGDEVVVSWQSVDGLNANLVEALEEVLKSYQLQHIHMEDELTSATSMGFLSSCVLRSLAMVNWYYFGNIEGQGSGVGVLLVGRDFLKCCSRQKSTMTIGAAAALVRTRQRCITAASDHGVTQPGCTRTTTAVHDDKSSGY